NSTAFRVYGRKPDGTVIRENHKTYAHALARKQELEIDTINNPLVLVMQPTRLTTAQLRDAEAAVHRLSAGGKNSAVSLATCVDHFLKTGRSTQAEITVNEAFEVFLADKKNQNLRDRTLMNIRCRVGNFAKSHGEKLVSEISSTDVKCVIQGADKSPVT